MNVLLNSNGEPIDEFNPNDVILVFNPDYFNLKKMNNSLFYRLGYNSINFISSQLISVKTKVLLFKLITLLVFNQGEILKINGMPANIKTISKYLGINIRTLQYQIKILERLEILKRIKNGKEKYLMINPYFICFGNKFYSESIRLFGNSQWVSYKKRKNNYKNIIKNIKGEIIDE